jgi:hypothetical protein
MLNVNYMKGRKMHVDDDEEKERNKSRSAFLFHTDVLDDNNQISIDAKGLRRLSATKSNADVTA